MLSKAEKEILFLSVERRVQRIFKYWLVVNSKEIVKNTHALCASKDKTHALPLPQLLYL